MFVRTCEDLEVGEPGGGLMSFEGGKRFGVCGVWGVGEGLGVCFVGFLVSNSNSNGFSVFRIEVKPIANLV